MTPHEKETLVSSKGSPSGNGSHGIPEGFYKISQDPRYLGIIEQRAFLAGHDLPDPYFTVQEGTSNHRAMVQGRDMINYSNYNYLELSGHPAVSQAAKEAVNLYGTSVGASRLVAGERPCHRELEKELASFLGTEDSIVYVGGFVTNVTAIGHLVGPRDIIFHDALSHNSILQGAILSRARRYSFPHNDFEALEKILEEQRYSYQRALIVLEGVYSMDGDVPELPRFIELKKKYGTYLMVDEAHSLGTLGATGRGIGELFDVARSDVDLWMGTLSKTLASCGGYVAGNLQMVEFLKYSTPGFIYSVGISPSNSAASLAALQVLQQEPQRVTQLREVSRLFLKLARERGLDTGPSEDTPIIPVIVGDSIKTIRLAHRLLGLGINVHPIFYPAVEEGQARLRFFLTCGHTEGEITYTIDSVAQLMEEL